MRLRATKTLCISSGRVPGSSLGGCVFDGLSPIFAASIRVVLSSYSGPLIRVRRSSDNSELDINAVSSVDVNGNRFIDSAALLAFSGAGSAYVVTWYDQSGNARNAIQASAENQPRIVNAGVVERVAGVPTVRIFETRQNLITSLFSPSGASGYTINCVAPEGSIRMNVFSYTNNLSSDLQKIREFDGTTSLVLGQTIATTGISAGVSSAVGTGIVCTHYNNGSNHVFYRSGTLAATAALNGVAQTSNCSAVIGVLTNSTFPVVISESSLFFYVLSDQQRTKMQVNQGTAYGITIA